MTQEPPHASIHAYTSNEEIDLVELLNNLWQEKLVILISILLAGILGCVYALMQSPVYQAFVQIDPPKNSDLSLLNNTQIISIDSNGAFSAILSELESESHKNKLLGRHKPVIAKALGGIEDNIISENILLDDLYQVVYPKPKKNESSVQPDIFTLKTEGADRDAIKELLNISVAQASNTLIDRWKNDFEQSKALQATRIHDDVALLEAAIKERRENKIAQLQEQNDLAIKKTEDTLAARKLLILKNRKDRILQLEEALKIAAKLGFKKPSSLSRLSDIGRVNNSGRIEVKTEINNQGEPLYLRGTELLNAELENLKGLPDGTFLDTGVRELETELVKLQTNRDVEMLKLRKNDRAFNDQLQSYREELRKLDVTVFPENFALNFLNSPATSPERPIKPRKMLIVAASLFLGGMFGFFIALGRIVYKSYKARLVINPVSK